MNSIVTGIVVFLLNRFAFNFTEDQRDLIQEAYYRIDLTDDELVNLKIMKEPKWWII